MQIEITIIYSRSKQQQCNLISFTQSLGSYCNDNLGRRGLSAKAVGTPHK